MPHDDATATPELDIARCPLADINAFDPKPVEAAAKAYK